MTIAEVSRKYDISADTLRYYERIGLIPQGHTALRSLTPAPGAACGTTGRSPAAGSS